MSRRANFARALASGYGTMVMNVGYTLLAVPLALNYLSTREFGLWAVVSQVAAYLALIDCGMSGSISRLLIDHKDDKSDGSYGTVAKTGAVVTVVQGLIAMAVGALAAPWAAKLADIPEDLRGIFVQLVVWQCVIFGASMMLKICTHLLNAHQRFDALNHAQTLSFLAMFATQWITFHAGCGLFSLVWSSLAGAVVTQAITIGACLMADVFPPRQARGRFSVTAFRGIFAFGAELFVQVLGWQLLGATQLIIVSNFLGLEAAATYVVCTRTFTLAQQGVWKVFDFSVAALSEMVARGEREKLRARFRDVLVLSGSLGVATAVIFAACNPAFVSLWTKGRVAWPPLNDWLLGGVLVAYTVNRVHGGLAWVAKSVRQMRYVFLAEGLVFVACGAAVAGPFGLPGVLIASIVCDFAISGTFGLARSATFLEVAPRVIVWDWLRPPARFLFLFTPVALGFWWVTRGLPPVERLLANAGVLGAIGAVLFWFFGLTRELQVELCGMWTGRRAVATKEPAPEARRG